MIRWLLIVVDVLALAGLFVALAVTPHGADKPVIILSAWPWYVRWPAMATMLCSFASLLRTTLPRLPERAE